MVCQLANYLLFCVLLPIHCQPPLNLLRWKIQCGAKCHLCGNTRPTTAHILNGCPIALEQGRYTWRHDCILSTLSSTIKDLIPEVAVFADLPNQRASEQPPSTIPPSILITPFKPDLVLIHKENKATVIELTCPTNTITNLQAARWRKQNKTEYGIIFSDLINQGWKVHYETLEIGSLGHHKKDMCNLLSMAVDLPKKVIQKLLDCCGKAAIFCSYQIFLARNFPSWSSQKIIQF